MGFAKPACHQAAGVLLPHRFTLTANPASRTRGGLFSVALSVGLLRLAVSQHRSLWSPDFPPVLLPRPATVHPPVPESAFPGPRNLRWVPLWGKGNLEAFLRRPETGRIDC